MGRFLLSCCFICVIFQWTRMQTAEPTAAFNCCRGDILLLLDSSGSVSNYEFARLLLFSANLLHVFSLGQGHVRVGLLQVGTNPLLEFGLDAHDTQESLQNGLWSVRQLQGDTNTEKALRVAKQLLTESKEDVPKILLWLTDGANPGDVDQLMSELKADGVFVLAVSTVHGNYQVLQRAVTPPLESHLYLVDIDNIEIITEDLRDAIIKIIHADQLRVVNLTPHSAVLQWRPLLSASSGHYELQYNSAWKKTRQILPGDSSWVELTNLKPDTTYTASLHPESNQWLFDTLFVNFTTDILSPAVVTISDSGPHQLHVEWGPLQMGQIQRYTVECGSIPSGDVRTVTLHSQQNSTLLTGLEPGTQYLVTVSALHANGKERAMSVRACTEEVALAALVDLQLTPVQHQVVQVMWRAHQEHLKGYWLTWERNSSISSSSKPSIVSVYMSPTSQVTQLTCVAPSSQVCVSPVYNSGRGDGICCTVERSTDQLS